MEQFPHNRDSIEIEAKRSRNRDGESGLEKILQNKYDLVVLDVMLPKLSGFEVCKAVRKKENDTPIILLTARSEEIDKVLGLELGADDYITKPFSVRELIARVKAILRRRENKVDTNSKQESIIIGNLEVNFSTYNAYNNKGEVQMSHKEFEILNLLWGNRNKTVSRDDLLRIIWGFDESPTTRTIDNFIVKLRQKIENNPNRPKTILTVHGIGYKLIC